MSAGHALSHRHLYLDGASRIHRLAPETKIAGLVAFVVVVALTPRRMIAAFAVDAAVLLAVVVVARVGAARILKRLAALTPFIAFAFLLPFLGDGEETRVAGLTLSVDGLWAMWNIVAKAVLGAAAGVLVTATTPVPELLRGMSRLRLPAVIVAIVAFMFRYLDLVVDQFARTRRAMVARGHDPHRIGQVRPLAASAGTLFVRTYERGERIHGAMAARGFTGTMPELRPRVPVRHEWALAAGPAVVALGALVLAAT